MLDRQSILEAQDLPQETLHIPEWNGSVIVRTMTAKDRDSFEAGLLDNKGNRNLINIRARLAQLTVCDEQGQLLFSEEDVPLLGAKSCKALDRILPVAKRLNGLSEEDIQELEKNS